MALYTLVSFFGLAFIMALSPGPNLLYLVTRSICQGRTAGFCSLFGIALGMFLHKGTLHVVSGFGVPLHIPIR